MLSGQNFRVALLASVASMGLVAGAQAASFTLSSNSSAAQTLNGGDTGTINSGISLNTTGSTIPVTWNLTAGATPTALTTINNSGTINASGSARAIDTTGSNGGGVRNFTLNNLTAASVLKSTSDALRINSDIGAGTVTINNAGTIQGAQGVDLAAVGVTAATGTTVITNSAGAFIQSTTDDAIHLPVGGMVTLNNQGTIRSTAAASRGIDVNPTTLDNLISLTLTNGSATNSGALISSAGDTFRLAPSNTSANSKYTISVDNFGTIQSTGIGANNGQALDFDKLAGAGSRVTITNEATGVIKSADADAIRPGANATTNNSGLITSSFNAAADINGNNSGNDAIDFQSNKGGVVVNTASGTIDGAKSGVTAKYAPSITNAGMIIGRDGSGINIDTSRDATPANPDITATGTVTVINTGTIIGTAVSADGDAIDVDYLVNVTNSGTIKAVGIVAPAVGSLNEGLAIGGGSVVNQLGGLIISDQRAITVDDSNDGPAFGAEAIDNFGTITGVDAQSNGIGAISITSTLSNSLINESTGVINGGVTMGAGNDSVTLFAGSTLNGALDGGAGADTLTLTGTGAGAFTNVRNFETLNVTGGTWTLSGTQGYATAVNVTGGTANVTGIITSPLLSVGSGATLTGTGKVGATSIASGATFTPGNGFTVNGNLALASGANTVEAVSPTAANFTSVNGSASLNGAFTANLAAGSYTAGRRFTVLTAAGGVTGTFASISAASPAFVKPTLSYDANDVFLTLSQVTLAANLSGPTGNQKAVAGAIDAAVAGGYIPVNGALALYGLSGAGLNSAIDQVSGQVNANVSTAVGEGFLSFLSLMTPDGGSEPGRFAPGQAYDGADAPSRAQLAPGQARVWAFGYGGTADLDGNATNGAAGLSASNYGFAVGVDTRLDPNLLAGLTLGVGHQDFNSGNGAGNSDDVMLGGYLRESIGNAYLAGSLAYGWHSISTSRTVTVSGTDVLNASFDAHDIGGRIEAGWRMPLESFDLTPYGAWTRSSFDAPAYSETAASGASTFALSYAERTTGMGRTELGAKLGRDHDWDGDILSANISAAWAHQLDDAPFVQGVFTGLPGSAFQVIGTHAAADSALLGGELKAQSQSGLSYGVKLQSQLGQGTTIFEGLGQIGWRW